MSVINDNIKQFIAEVEKFFQETLKNEKISKKAQEHKQLILDKLTKLFEESPYLRVSIQDSAKGKDNHDESAFTGGSTKSDGSSEEVAYTDYGIPVTAAAELQNAFFAGNLEKKQRKGTGLFASAKLQTRWCVIHNGNFYYYVRNDDKKQCGCFKLEGYQFRNNPDITKQKKDKELAFELYSEDKSKRVYQFVASNKADYENVKTAVMCGGILTEDDVYDQVGGEEPPPPAEEEYVEDVGVGAAPIEPSEVYEDPDSAPPPTEPVPQSTPPPPVPRGPANKSSSALPPLPATPVPTKHAETPLPEPPAEDQEELYEEASSSSFVPPDKSSEEPPPPPPPPTRGLPHLPHSESPATRRLPPTPVEPPKKKKIKLNITCKPDEDFENKYFGKWDCKGDNPQELSFRKGDIIYILSREFDEKSWWIGELNGKFGLVPKTYLTPAYTLAF